jgi:hypothetical protein
MITSSLSKSLFYKFKNHSTAKDLWKALQITFEGTDDVKIRKAATLQRQYEMFAMIEGESIDDMHGRFQIIVNELLALGTEFSKAQNNMKILDSLTTPWQNLATSIIVNRDMKTASIDELIGALKAHEIHLASRQIIRSNAGKALKADESQTNTSDDVTQKKGKSKMLKAESSEDSDTPSDESTDDEIALMSRRFKQMLKKKGRSNRLFKRERKPFRRSSKEEVKEIVCYECKKSGHMKADCPRLKRRSFPSKRKKKNLLATWEDLDSTENSDESDEEIANLFLMTNEDTL